MPFKRQRVSAHTSESIDSVPPKSEGDEDDDQDFEGRYIGTDDAVEAAGYVHVSHGWIQRARKDQVLWSHLRAVHISNALPRAFSYPVTLPTLVRR